MEDFFFHFYKKLVTSGYLKTGYLNGYLRVEVTRGHQKKNHAYEFEFAENVKSVLGDIFHIIELTDGYCTNLVYTRTGLK